MGKEADVIQKKNVLPILNIHLYKLHMQTKMVKNSQVEDIYLAITFHLLLHYLNEE